MTNARYITYRQNGNVIDEALNREAQHNASREEDALAAKTREIMTLARERRVDLEELAADQYQEKKERGVDPEDIIDAMTTLAAAFYSPSTSCREDANGDVPENDLEFQQRMMLGNVVGNANWMLESAVKFLNDNHKNLERKEDRFDGSDNAIEEIIKVQDRIEVAQTLQVPHCSEYLPITAAAYRAVIGEAWQKRAAQGKGEKEQKLAALKARSMQLRA